MTGASVPRDARPGIAAILSGVVPGAGQWYGGRLRRAVLLFLPLVAIAAAAYGLWSLGETRILELVVQPSVLWTLLAANLIVLGWREFVVVDAFRIARNGSRPGVMTTIVLAATIAAVVVFPLVALIAARRCSRPAMRPIASGSRRSSTLPGIDVPPRPVRREARPAARAAAPFHPVPLTSAGGGR